MSMFSFCVWVLEIGNLIHLLCEYMWWSFFFNPFHLDGNFWCWFMQINFLYSTCECMCVFMIIVMLSMCENGIWLKSLLKKCLINLCISTLFYPFNILSIVLGINSLVKDKYFDCFNMSFCGIRNRSTLKIFIFKNDVKLNYPLTNYITLINPLTLPMLKSCKHLTKTQIRAIIIIIPLKLAQSENKFWFFFRPLL